MLSWKSQQIELQQTYEHVWAYNWRPKVDNRDNLDQLLFYLAHWGRGSIQAQVPDCG